MALRLEITNQPELWDLFSFSWDRAGEGLEQTLARVTEHCATCFAASGASLFLKSAEDESYPLTASSGLDGHIPKSASVMKGVGIAGACIELGKPLIVENPKDNPALSGRKLGRRPEIGSSMVIPLIAGGECIGVMNLSRRSKASPFQNNDLERAESAVRYVALAVENARLFAHVTEATNRAQTLQTKLHEIIHSLGVAIIVVDSMEEITEANREALKLLGNLACKKGQTGLLACVLQSLHAAVKGKIQRTRFHDVRSGRSWTVCCTPLNSGGATAAIEEVTELETAGKEMARLNRLAEIGQMSAAIAHEIRNPLTSIVVAGNMVQEYPEQSQEMGKMIQEEALKLNDLCDQFLEFARPLALRETDLNFAAIAQHLARQHQHEFDESGVHLVVQVEASTNMIQGDALRLEQVMRNLILNALQACGRGGEVLVKVRTNGFFVQDDGVGMTEETMGRLFTPFFTTKAKGTGLGLSTVRKIIEAHGGQVVVRSKPGKGSTFEVRLPEGGN